MPPLLLIPNMAAAESLFTAAEVARHNTAESLWVSIDDGVYDLTKFQHLHPGGLAPLKDVAGKDATELFYGLHRAGVLQERRYRRLRVGKLVDGVPAADPADLATVPYGEAMGYWRKFSPYYTESHERLRAAMRAFFDAEVMPDAVQVDENDKEVPMELNKKMGEAGIIACTFGMCKEALHKFGFRELPGGVKAEEWDLFHSLVACEETKRIGCYGYTDGLLGGQGIGLPPVINFGSEDLQQRIVPAVLRGDKRICLAISEPYAGSDVSKVRCRAVRAADGSGNWVVNGVKKWITGGYWADYFTTLCRSDEGMVLLLVERHEGNGLSTKQIKTSYSATAGTSYVMYDDVVVPAANLIGQAGKGFMHVMHNFNMERWSMIAGGNRMSRLMVEEAFKWSMQRKVFGKRLLDQPVIRFKLAQMAADVEGVHSMLEDLTFQMSHMTEEEMNAKLAGTIALLKVRCQVSVSVVVVVDDVSGGQSGGQAGGRAVCVRFAIFLIYLDPPISDTACSCC